MVKLRKKKEKNVKVDYVMLHLSNQVVQFQAEKDSKVEDRELKPWQPTASNQP